MVFVQLDPVGLAVIIAEVIVVLLLVIGVYSEEKRENTVNLLRHGFFGIAALAVTVALIAVFMIPVFLRLLDVVQFPVVWLHAATGMAAVVFSVIMVAAWLREPLADLGCSKVWKLMIPTIVLWALALGLGAFVHLFGLR